MSAQYLLIAALLLTKSYSMTTEVLAGSNVCYDTLQYSHDTFSPPYDGTIIGVKLVHSSGGVTCSTHIAPTNWGCVHGSFINVMKERVKRPLRIYPTPNTNGISDIRPISISNNPTCACDYWFYTIGNKDDNSAQYQIKDADNPVRVRTSDSYTLQYSEGCCGVTTSDNSGSACADVYFLYDTIKPSRVVITPGSESSNPDIRVQIGDGRNGITRAVGGQKKFEIYGENTAAQEFPLAVRLDGDEYGFMSGSADSQFAFTLRARCVTDECDLFGVIQIGTRYMSFLVELDGAVVTSSGQSSNVQVYPACGSRLARGDASELLKTIDSASDNRRDLGRALAGGDEANWDGIGDLVQDENFPLTFEISNNDIKDRFTFRFASPSYPNGVECTYKGAAPTDANIKLYLTPDWGTSTEKTAEIMRIASIAINGNKYRSALTIADIFAYEMALDVAAEEAGIVEYVGEIEEDDVDYFMVEYISKWRRNLDDRYNYYVKIGGFVVLSMVVVVLVGLLYKYYFAGYNRKSKNLSSENDPLLNNVNVQTN